MLFHFREIPPDQSEEDQNIYTDEEDDMDDDPTWGKSDDNIKRRYRKKNREVTSRFQFEVTTISFRFSRQEQHM